MQSSIVMATAASTPKVQQQTIIRRSGNYRPLPSDWEFDKIQSLSSRYAGKNYVKRRDELKEIVKKMLEEKKKDSMDLLELIDDLQRLGLSYHFESQIKRVLKSIYNKFDEILRSKEDDLYAKALLFRLFRQHGFIVSSDIFNCFKDEEGFYKKTLCKDVKGMLYLYEASYLLLEGENTLDLAKEFTKKHLKKSLDDQKLDKNLVALVHHSLELPLHWRMIRLEARWFIDIYEKRVGMNIPLVLEFAKLDFNITQAIYQDELKDVTRWWKNTKVVEKLTYTRDCAVQSYLWAVGMIGEPQYGYARKMGMKNIALITMLDDTYDIYGTLEELELFTNVIESWDINVIDQLPDYMQVCFLVLYNSVNEMAYHALNDHGINTIPYLKKMWTDLCKAYLVEAKWYYSGYKPTLEEYITNAMVSIATPPILAHASLQVDDKLIKEDILGAICNYPDVVRCSAKILRLVDDLGTCSDELERGDVPKSVQCYMIETGASEEQAREHIKYLISEAWKKMNKDQVSNSLFSEVFIKMAMNIDRAAHCVYEFGDGHGNVNSVTRDRISTLFFEPIPVEISTS